MRLREVVFKKEGGIEMRGKIYKKLCILTAAAMLAGGVCQPVSAETLKFPSPQNAEERQAESRLAAKETGTIVYSTTEFMEALSQKKSPITVANLVTIGTEADTDHQMLPVKIPAGTVIRGQDSGYLNCRSPIQLEGDVYFQDIKVVFESSDALGSVPHREIFLAGHSLTFDNVRTYLEGGDGLGGLGGTEKELLPTVYAGGYTNTQIGEAASLHVINSNEETMFQAIYMGHEAGSDNKVPYRGAAVVDLDPKAIVRGCVDVGINSEAKINISGSKTAYAKTKEFQGNGNTVLTLSGCSLTEAVLKNIGTVVLTDNACLGVKSNELQNITLRRGGCLDLNGAEPPDVRIAGDFTGVENPEEERGILVVNQLSTLMIEGKVTGTTQFQTSSRFFPGTFHPGYPYISAVSEHAASSNFVLAEKSIENGYQLNFDKGNWTVSQENQEESIQIGEIEIVSAPSQVVLDKIFSEEYGPAPDESVYFEVIWKDTEGNPISSQEAEEWMLYESDYVILVKTDYWVSESPDVLEKVDWNNAITLMTSEEHPGKYFLQALDGAKTGDYTFLFCSEYYTEVLNTVQDVKKLKDKVKAECRVTFLDKEPDTPGGGDENPDQPGGGDENPDQPGGGDENPDQPGGGDENPDQPGGGDENPDQPGGGGVTPDLPEEEKPPVHTHNFAAMVTKATVKTNGVRISRCSCGTIKSQEVIYSPEKITLSAVSKTYTGKAQKPDIKVTDKNGKLISSSNYKVTYQNNVNVGRASVTICFQGDYSGELKKSFDIIPKRPSLTKLVPKSKGFVAKWKKQGKQAAGYQIQYSTSKKFAKKSSDTITVKSNKTTSKKLSVKKAGKRYYVRIRTYKNVKVNGKTKKFYSE